jgi:methyl-accepting chemotaxis protein
MLMTTSAGRTAAWLSDAAERRDLSPAAAPSGEPDAAAAARFVAGLGAEMRAFRAIIEDAVDAVERNASQLATLTAFADHLQIAVEATATAMAEIDRGAFAVAHSGEALRTMVGAMATSMTAYAAALDELAAGFATLIPTIESTAAFATAMDAGASGIAAFLNQLQRIARQARLLAINAAIEAAHLGEAGHGFVIVAEEVKKLSTSTASSAQSVGEIERSLHDTSAQVTRALGDSIASIRALRSELSAGRERANGDREQIAALEAATSDVAAIAGEQSAALSQIATGVERVAESTGAIAGATRRASDLGLGGALARLREMIERYTLAGASTDEPSVSVEELPESLQTAAGTLRTRVDADQRDILGLISRMSVAIARNSYEWKAIAGGIATVREHLVEVVTAIEQTAAGAAGAAGAAETMRRAIETLRSGFVAAIDALGATLEGVSQVREQVGGTEAFAAATSAAGERAAAILDIIDAISGDTTLLALNAAIEAAHAGAAGSGFGVIADEIKHLADTTLTATQAIGDVLGGVKRAGVEMRDATQAAVARTAAVHDSAAGMRAIVAKMRGDLDHTLASTAEVATIVDQQQAALSDARTTAGAALARVAGDAAIATDVRRLELAMLGMRAHGLAARRPLGTTAEAIRALGLEVAAEMDQVFDQALARGGMSLEDCFDTDYQLLAGERIRELGRLFDVSRVPASGFEPPKFATRYDRAVEDGFNAIIDRSVPRHAAIAAMFAVDLNGYCFGHYRECRRDWTGDATTDLNHNRIKRFFEDALSLRCSRAGLGAAADALPARSPYAAFRSAGCALTLETLRPWAIYTYARDTGVVYNDLSVGIFARGQRVGTIRIIYDADSV